MAGNRGVYGEGYCLGECLFFLPIPKYMEGVRSGIRGSDSPPDVMKSYLQYALSASPLAAGCFTAGLALG